MNLIAFNAMFKIARHVKLIISAQPAIQDSLSSTINVWDAMFKIARDVKHLISARPVLQDSLSSTINVWDATL